MSDFKDKEPLVSFIVLSYNAAHYIKDCIDSIINQEGDYAFEIIVVDDASTDSSKDIILSYKDSKVHFISHERNLGHAATLNDGIAAARGNYIARIDADDRYRPYFLKETLGVFGRFPELGLVYGDAALINEKNEVTCERSESCAAHGNKDFKGNELVKLLEFNLICSPTVIACRQAWKEALPVPSHLAFHDWYFTIMIARRYEFYYINRVIADYRVHAYNLHPKLSRDKSMESSTFWLLDRIYSEKEQDAELEEKKRRRKKKVYGRQYLIMADKYFGFDMYQDARRCYLNALNLRPEYIVKAGLVRRLFASFIGQKPYELSKYVIKRMLRFFVR